MAEYRHLTGPAPWSILRITKAILCISDDSIELFESFALKTQHIVSVYVKNYHVIGQHRPQSSGQHSRGGTYVLGGRHEELV
jgi:hypothetical protein